MNLPSIKTLQIVARGPDEARAMRKILEDTVQPNIALMACDPLMARGCGVEYIPYGSNAKSPAIYYVNTGDGYRATLMYVMGRGYRVGCWADIVERGKYK